MRSPSHGLVILATLAPLIPTGVVHMPALTLLAMTHVPGHEPSPELSPAVTQARIGRALAASLLVEGDRDLATLALYKRYLTASLLLGDITVDEADASLNRARTVYATNIGKVARSAATKDPTP